MAEELLSLLGPPANGERFVSLAWPNMTDGVDEHGLVGKGHIGLPPAYMQTAGMDVLRDDTMLYERVLREESGVLTRLDMYEGFPHCAWRVIRELEVGKRWEEDTVEGLKWLLEKGRSLGK